MQNSRNPHTVSEDTRFNLMDDSVMSNGLNITLNTNLTIVTLTTKLNGAMIFCATTYNHYLGNFTIRVYSESE